MSKDKLNGMRDCERMPEVLDRIFSAENMSELPTELRQKLRKIVEFIEGSSPRGGMTCVAREDYQKVTDEIRKGMDKGCFSPYLLKLGYAKQLQGFIRSMNRHCDECTREDCENRVELTREQIKEMTKPGAPVSSRGSKIGLPLVGAYDG